MAQHGLSLIIIRFTCSEGFLGYVLLSLSLYMLQPVSRFLECESSYESSATHPLRSSWSAIALEDRILPRVMSRSSRMHLCVLSLISAMATLAGLAENKVCRAMVPKAIIRNDRSQLQKLFGHLVAHGKTVWRLIQQLWAI